MRFLFSLGQTGNYGGFVTNKVLSLTNDPWAAYAARNLLDLRSSSGDFVC